MMMNPQDSMGMEMLAAALRADSADSKVFLEALATKLSSALPGQVQVQRHGGFFSKEKPVREVLIALTEFNFTIGRDDQGRLQARRAKVVRGIALKTEDLPVHLWIDYLAQELSRVAQESEQARMALERLLLG